MTPRNRRSQAQWQRLIQQQEESGLSSDEFCRQQNQDHKYFCKRKREFRLHRDSLSQDKRFIKIQPTQTTESLNYSLCRVLKTKGVFPNDESIKKILYLAIRNISKKWRACPAKRFGYHANSELETSFKSICNFARR